MEGDRLSSFLTPQTIMYDFKYMPDDFSFIMYANTAYSKVPDVVTKFIYTSIYCHLSFTSN